MSGRALAAVLLVVAGAFVGVPIAVILGIISLLLETIRAVWARYGLRGVTYRRTLAGDRTTWGDEIPMTIEVWNRKRLPLAWLRADDDASFGTVVRERELVDGSRGSGALRNVWTLAPFERVTRTYHVGAERRGVYDLGPVDLAVGDLFARQAAIEERDDRARFIVRPRTVATMGIERPEQWGGLERAKAGLTEDPSRFAGVRPYAPGDPLRRVHQRASARLGTPVTKRFEPSRDREVLIALDVQTAHGPAWEIAYEADDVEALYVVAASVARALATEKAAFGIAAAGFTGAESRFATVPISSAGGQAERVLDLLARLSTHASAPFERLLALLRRIARPGTTILVITARDPTPFAGWLRRLEAGGCRIVVLACGRDAVGDATRAQSAGFGARAARLNGPWQTASALEVAS
jgi:uncharacterized protein (DUF58 family)